ncbi:MAG: outer membrane protein assembly factor BamB family protein, partial [Planctomycetota bacterium]
MHKHNVTTRACTYAAAILLSNLTASGEQGPVDWNQFRGPNGQGVSEAGRVPVRFGPDSKVLWKTPIPPGQSSPVVSGDRVFFTACEPRNGRKLITLCVDRKTGKILWRQVTSTGTRGRHHPMNGPASPTPTVDREHLYVYFPTWGLLCYDHRGKSIWSRKLETPRNDFGTATSPILYKDKVILLLDDNSGNSRLLAVKRRTGETVWEQPRPLVKQGWSTPMIWRHGDTDELIVLGFKRLTSYDPSTGAEIWWAGGFSAETIGVPVAGEGLL